jgi:DNA-binding XRE family transcriptional regulator
VVCSPRAHPQVGCYPDSVVTPIVHASAAWVGGTDKGKTPRQEEFGRRVRWRREELGFSQEKLALKAGINRTYIGSLETGMRNPSLDLVARLARALGVDAGELVTGLEKKRGRG